MSFLQSLPGLSQKGSSKPPGPQRKRTRPPADLLGFDLLFQLTHLSALAAAGASRAKLMSMAAAVPASSAVYFQEVDRIALSMNYQYAEACRIVGERTQEDEARGLLFRLSSALNTGENEADFLAGEAAVQAESYGNVYERKLESLKKWTDAFTALIVSAALIVVVATVSTMIYDIGTIFVVSLVLTTMLISIMGVWIIYGSSPREIRTLRGPAAERSQARIRRARTLLLPVAMVVAAAVVLLKVNVGFAMIGFGLTVLPVGLLARRLDGRITRADEDITTFLRVLGSTMTAIGTTPVVAIGRMDMRAMPSLTEGVRQLRTRLLAGLSPGLSWARFVNDTGSELVARSMRVFLDGINAGGDAEEVGKRASLMSSKIVQLRAKRRLVSETFTYLSMAMHATIAFLLIFIVEVISNFSALIFSATDLPLGAGAGLGSLLAFNLANLSFLRTVMPLVVLVLSVVSALAPKVANGGYSLTFFYYLGLTVTLAGAALVAAPVLGGVLFVASTFDL